MKKKEKESLRAKNSLELAKECRKKEKELVMARLQKAQGKLKDVKTLAKIRDKIAVIKTIIREKQLKEEDEQQK